MQVRLIPTAHAAAFGRSLGAARDLAPVWFWLGLGIFGLLLSHGALLLNDSDTYWHISIGRWIIDHASFPQVDFYSFTKAGERWVSSSWLSQVVYAEAFRLAGWAGPVTVAAGSVALTFALLARRLERDIPAAYALMVALTAMVLSTPHLLARPHVLVMPLIVLWASRLLDSSSRGEAPPLAALPIIAIWANFHGSFVFGLILAAGIGFDALWNAEPTRRWRIAARWAGFGAAALLACCLTPYGWGTILAARRILDLGELLHLISEWMPANFATFGAFEASILGSIGCALYCGVRLPLPRILLVLGVLHMALAHVRNIEIFALLAPLMVVGPVSAQFRLTPGRSAGSGLFMTGIALAVGLCGLFYASRAQFTPTPVQSPAAAVDAMLAHQPKRILNDMPFGGYLISRNVPVFLDGRSELYGEAFEMAYFKALQLKDIPGLLDILKRHDIDAVILTPDTPAVGLLDMLPGWRRIFTDKNAIVHLRSAN